MPMTDALPGVSLTTGTSVIINNPINSGERRTYELTFVNKSASEAIISSCDFYIGATPNPIVPPNFKVAAGDGFTLRKVLKPDTNIKAAASAAGAIHVTVDQIYAEPA